MKATADRMEVEWYASNPKEVDRDEDEQLRRQLERLVLLIDAATRGLDVVT